MNFYEIFWPSWLVLFILAFVVVEFFAVFKEKKDGSVDTLTSWIQSRTKSDWIKDIVATVLIALPVWLVFHLWI